ncbi:DNA methyltransferase [Protofrankia symbiont of Coriaria myrtifolia]|uniref:site-specific DNA-methyltransferase (cytosine-N(4)-specific) n=1 Tax=Candidatus Protofrankia datiscae TaxID=2716812 RepID=F8AWH9_9ACTN|nr:DNA methyltransferase [Protofrankia symbiont of Coriaria myrtifolia]AEH08384.1 DNA methylase N-4/N-6 domain protein [Candidatus Protofrankia datiscae]
MTAAVGRPPVARNEHMTFRANMGVGRHGWLRLTPAYGVRLVRESISRLPAGSVVTDPFSGTGTTPLAAAELGRYGQSVDVNPFLVWLGRTKVRHYPRETLLAAVDATHEVVRTVTQTDRDAVLWQPDIFNIERWWTPGTLHALKALRAAIDTHEGAVRDLLEIALCRTLIARSNAAFNHQSMSFRTPFEESAGASPKDVGDGAPALFDQAAAEAAISAFALEMDAVLRSAACDLPGSAAIHQGDSRTRIDQLREADLIITSPPYVNRMSYVRELRPYMYWLRFLNLAGDAGDLDWRAIGGTWGTATSKLNGWRPEVDTPVDDAMAAVCARIAADGGKNGPLLATYVHRYHHDMWLHFQAVTPAVKRGGVVSYIVGNSTFYGHEVPAHTWYATMLRALAYTDVEISTIRKRNSNKSLYEYNVSARRP